MSCKQCGMCCKAIVIAQDFSKITGSAIENGSYNFRFIKKWWKQITRKEALEINPYLKQWGKFLKGKSFYTCLKLVDGKCSVHYERPDVCSGFPYYGHNQISEKYYSKTCGFKLPSRKIKTTELEE